MSAVLLKIIRIDGADEDIVGRCLELGEAKAFVEDLAVELWEMHRDPNQPGAQLFPGIEWNNATWTASLEGFQTTWRIDL